MFTARYGLDLYVQFSTNKIQQINDLLTRFIYVFCVDLRTNSDYFPIQHELTRTYNRDGECLLRGTDLIFMYSSVPTRFNKSTICSRGLFMCFVWI